MKHARGRRHEDVDVSSVSPDRIMKLGYAYREAKALLSAVELGVFTSLAPRCGNADAGTLAVSRQQARQADDDPPAQPCSM
jgi:hypothetical protein